MKSTFLRALATLGASLVTALHAAPEPNPTGPPNVVLIFTDDQGYSDLGCFGAEGFRTPQLDRLASEGTRFTSFYVAQAVCTASRAALMTGCYANRVGLFGALNHTSTQGIHPNETLLPEIFKGAGYATAIFGKWHLGTRPEFNPLRHGFDEFLGIPYSNDNSKYHPIVRDMPPLPLYDGEEVVELDPDQSQFTRRLTERAVRFIDKHQNKPFFLYVPHIMPHVPIFASKNFQGRTARGLYGDVIEEIDWSVGEILHALTERGLDRRTLVIFASDNGPFLSYGDHAGRATPLREGKLTTFEGGVRVPCLMRWPGHIPAGRTCDEPIATIDLLPTLARIIGTNPPSWKLDGLDIGPLLRGEPGAKSPHEALVFYAGEELQSLRAGDWKLHFPHPYLTVAAEPGRNGKPSNWENLTPDSITQSGLEGIASRHGYRVERLELSLFNLREDPGETRNLAAQHPEIVQRLQALAVPYREELGDKLTGAQGRAIRPAARFAFDTGRSSPGPRVVRFESNPIIRPDMLAGREGSNINGPSLIRVPDWVKNPLGRYYLYFAHHGGNYIRLAYADQLSGPWKVYPPGTLRLKEAPGCRGHIASPDVVVDDERRELRLYFHGPAKAMSGQMTFVAVSQDGLQFEASPEILGNFYWRVFRWDGWWYGMGKGGLLHRSRDGLTGFEQGPNPFPGSELRNSNYNDPGPRHLAVHQEGARLWIYYSNIGDLPERILRVQMDLTGDWTTWRTSEPEEVLRPETPWEGADLALRPSTAGAARGLENAVRDPGLFVEDNRIYLIYSIAGEAGLALAEIKD